MRAKVERLEGHHFRFTIRGMKGDFDVTPSNPQGPSPKEMLLAALCACTGTDVVDLLKKFNVQYEKLELEALADLTEAHPIVFKSIDLKYVVSGSKGQNESIIEAVKRSTHQYSGTAAILSKTCPIEYQIYVDQDLIKTDQVSFSANRN